MGRSFTTTTSATVGADVDINIGRIRRRLLQWTAIAGVFVCSANTTPLAGQTPGRPGHTAFGTQTAPVYLEAPRPEYASANDTTGPTHHNVEYNKDRLSGHSLKPQRTQWPKPNSRLIHVDPVTMRPVAGDTQHHSKAAAPSAISQTAGQQIFLPQTSGHDFSHRSLIPLAIPPAGPESDTPLPITVDPEPWSSGPVGQTNSNNAINTDTADRNALIWWEQELPQPLLKDRTSFPLTLRQALSLALTEAPELEVLESDWYIRRAEADRQAAAFDWTTFVDTIWNRDSVPVSSALDGAAVRLRSRTLNVVGGLRRRAADGSEIEFSQNAGLKNSNSQFISPNNQGTTRLALQYERPLLRGAGEDYNTSPQRLAVLEQDSAYDRFQAGIQDHLLEVATAYWTLVMRRGRFLQASRSWQRVKQIADEMAVRTEVDVTPGMLDRARSEVATRRARMIESEHDIVRAQDALLRLIYGARYSEFAAGEVLTTTLPLRQTENVSPDAHVEQALKQRSEVHQVIREIKSATIRYDVAANEVLPALDFVLTSYVAGLRGDNDVGDSFLSQFREGEPGVGVGLNFEIPYRNRAAQAYAEQNHIAIRRAQARLQTTLGQITEDVRDQVIQRNKYGAVLSQRWESLARARRILGYTETRREVLADGTEVADLYLENLLMMQSRLENAESTYLESQVRYTLADNSLLRAVSQLDTIAAESPVGQCDACQPETFLSGGTATDIDWSAGHSITSRRLPIVIDRSTADRSTNSLSYGHELH